MELTVTIDDDAKLRIQTLSGKAKPEDLSQAVEEVYKRPDFNPDHNFVWDLRQCTMENVSSDAVRQFAMFVTVQWTATGIPPKGAFVVSRDLEFGLSRLFTSYLDADSDFRIFRDMDEAIEWLTSQFRC